MIEIIHRYDPREPERPRPANAEEACSRLVEGNRRFMEFWSASRDPHEDHSDVIAFDPRFAGLLDGASALPQHRAHSAVLSCSDARVPTEFVFRQTFNDLFVVRVAGNIITDEGLGSLAFAARALGDSVKLMVVLGHRGCGAVIAAVESYLDPDQYPDITASGLRTVIDRIGIVVRLADQALQRQGDRLPDDERRERLVSLSVCLNAAHTAMTLRQQLAEVIGGNQKVVFGVFDLGHHVVWGPDETRERPWETPALVPPPGNHKELQQLADWLARQPR